MSRETYAERKAREAARDNIRDFALDVANHVAGASMVAVEQLEPGQGVRFSHHPPAHRCDCGLPMGPFPVFYVRYGILPLWLCAICQLEDIVAVCREISEHAIRPFELTA